MMKLPQISGPRLIRILEGWGFYVKRLTGGHAIMVHRDDPSRRAVIPVHGSKPIRPGTLRAILDGLQLSIQYDRAVAGQRTERISSRALKKSLLRPKIVMPAKAGIQKALENTGFRFHGNDGKRLKNSFSATC
ncbi:MAG: type II toxin-antitoxin system HicA family toxin [Nitrospinae bacterium]|nr:type II toxin-antitoxin system HicA family toxin [Nitrospinota bacterium]